jgi:hypothetical protein
MERAQEATHHQIVEALVVAGERHAGERARRNDGEVVGDPGVVEDAPLVLETVLAQRRGRRRVVGEPLAVTGTAREGLERLPHRLAIVLGQAARAGARVGEQLVPLVAALGRRERATRRPAEAAIALPLQAGEVEQRRRRLA